MPSRHAGRARIAAVVTCALATLATVAPRTAAATLGGGVATIAEDGRALGAASTAPRRAARFSVYELRRDGLTLREFVDDAGTVFAVGWRGVNHPDMARLLGDYRADYEEAAKRDLARDGHDRRRVVVGARVVVMRFGHLPSVFGLAYVPALLPQGVSIHDLS